MSSAPPETVQGPRGPQNVPPLPHGSTARRLDWPLLPPHVRRTVEERFGTRVVEAHSAGAGFTPGCASLLVGADGRQLFLKAASRKAQRPFADAYAQEIANLRRLPAGLPVPRMLWSHQDDLWVLLALEPLAGANPVRPWDERELEECLDTLQVLAETLTPPPFEVARFSDDFAGLAHGWHHVRRTSPHWPHLEEAAALAARLEAVTDGNTVVHTDARDDNFVLGPGGARLCDWNFPVRGAAWIDTVCLLMTAYGDGLDADALLADRALTRDVEKEHVDVLLALLCGYFLERRDQPAPYSSPFLRRHQDWCGEVSWAWLAARRGWV